MKKWNKRPLRIEEPTPELIADAISGDSDAWCELYTKYYRYVFNIAYGILKDRCDTEDIVSEVFLKLSTHLHTFTFRSKFSSWLYSITRNKSQNRLRDLSRIHRTECPVDFHRKWILTDAPLTDLSSDNLLNGESLGVVADIAYCTPEPDERCALILAEIEKLPDELKTFLDMSLDYSSVQIARETGLSLNSVKYRILKARRIVRERVEASL